MYVTMKSSKILILFYWVIIILQVAENQACLSCCSNKEKYTIKTNLQPEEKKPGEEKNFFLGVNKNIMHVILEYLDSSAVLCGLVKTNNAVSEQIKAAYPNSFNFFGYKTVMFLDLSLPCIEELHPNFANFVHLLQRPILTKKLPDNHVIELTKYGFEVTPNFSLVKKSNKWKLLKLNLVGNSMFYNFQTQSLLIYKKTYRLYETKCPFFFQFLFPDSETFLDEIWCRLDDLIDFQLTENSNLYMTFINQNFDLSFNITELHEDEESNIYQFKLPITNKKTDEFYSYLAIVESSELKVCVTIKNK